MFFCAILVLLPVVLVLWLLWWSDRPPALLLVAVLAVAGCSAAQQTQAVTAHGIAKSANAATPLLVEAYDLEGRAVIVASLTRDEAEERLDAVRERWRPVWEAHAVFVTIHGAWATALEAGTLTPAVAAEVREAYCTLRAVAAPSVPLPDFPAVPCGGAP